MIKGNIFELKNGQPIELMEIYQSKTYLGLLEGYPTTKMNKHKIESAIKKATKLWDDEPYLIEPQETPIEGASFSELMKVHFGTPASIPKLTCLAWFQG